MRKKNFVTLLYFSLTPRQKAVFAKTGVGGGGKERTRVNGLCNVIVNVPLVIKLVNRHASLIKDSNE